ncbi:putative baseplate assembly protein [Goodfellowiella coeruleoviolacea]|uniref:Baseplate assembly protein n=1 Tax=Goodfellowiella coeruleoviolacea TaxID=334858 RepID=A0AAE3G9F8_9PSEU|nr:putative baseplate assembly protein [Goodfellowiella coeruleoviolacea]MCP2163329.1 putative baseplate assembly protein [Goodfellowiella coeruleoviolacea]
MSVPAPRLDDLSWADMVAAIRRRIPAESGGSWTLHAPADPGVTLLELFAYLLEQRLYWLDQVPDALVVAVLRLLGLDPPRPARAAATVLRLTADWPGTPVPVVPAGTVLTRDPLGVVTFTLDEDVAVFPVDPAGEVTVWTDRDRTADLRARRGVSLLGGAGGAAEARFTLPLTGALPAPGWLSLLVELDAPAASPPSWSPDAVDDVPAPAALTWSWFRPGEPGARAFAEVVDGTAGLRRSGVVRLRPPADWTTQDRGLLVATSAATFSAPPRLLQVAVNVSAARHREHRRAGPELVEQVRAWLRLPGQHLVLPDAEDRLLAAEVHLAGQEWTPAPDFTFGASTDRIFLVDRAEGAVVFGDGLTGRIPHPTDDVWVDYVIGGGRSGNGGTTGNWVPTQDAVLRRGALVAANLVQAAGGADPETVAQARQRAAAALGEVTRAVTEADFVTLARTTPGVAVARAHAALGEHPGLPCAAVPGAVTVHIVPLVPRDGLTGADGAAGADVVAAPVPDPGMVCAVAARLAQARLLTTEVFVRAPAYRAVRLRVDLSGAPADRARVSTVLTAALRRYLDPLVGGDDGTGWPFGGPLRPSALLRAVQRALGELAEVAGVAVGLDGAEADQDCQDVALRPGELPVLRGVRTRVVAPVESGEGLL